jgi:hypothetical protein
MSTILKGLISANLAPANGIEDGAFQLRDALWLKNAIGAQLDLLGRVYNETRQGRNDTDYRKVLQIRAASAINGNPDEICSYLKAVYGYTDIEYLNENVAPHYHMAFFIDGTAPTAVSMPQLQQMAPAGVGAYVADYLGTVDGNVLGTVDGVAFVTPRTATTQEVLQDGFTSSDIYRDTLTGAEYLIDTLGN